ncbi:MAG: hypothetical protein M1374_01395 [Firmicutes bacterium]|nr:hypothetical protein [Bacillota bacterium]
MIVVKIEQWPDGADIEDPRERLRPHADIAWAVLKNDKTGTDDLGNYEVRLYDPPPYNPWAGAVVKEQVSNFPRKRLGVWDLLHKALTPLVKDTDRYCIKSYDEID